VGGVALELDVLDVGVDVRLLGRKTRRDVGSAHPPEDEGREPVRGDGREVVAERVGVVGRNDERVVAAGVGAVRRLDGEVERAVDDVGVVARAALQQVVATPAVQRVVALPADEMVVPGAALERVVAVLLIFCGYTRRSQRHIPSEGMSGISTED
jgi:hypothetical protein